MISKRVIQVTQIYFNFLPTLGLLIAVGFSRGNNRQPNQGSKCWVPRFPQALNIFHGNSTLHLEFPAGNPAKNAGNSSYAWGINV